MLLKYTFNNNNNKILLDVSNRNAWLKVNSYNNYIDEGL